VSDAPGADQPGNLIIQDTDNKLLFLLLNQNKLC
jgi:hypothetical protein